MRKLLLTLVLVVGLAAPSAGAAPQRALPYAGKTLMGRDVASYGALYWGGVGLVKFTATALGESHGSLGAWHDNGDVGLITSRDCGLLQVNIPARLIGTELEDRLRTTSLDPTVYGPVAAYNTARAKDLYDTPWARGGLPGVRQWQPWVAYTTGWATFPGWWVWARPALDRWAATGRYVQQAIVGVANYRLVIKRDVNPEGALYLARQYAAVFKVQGALGYDAARGIVRWTSVPPRPTAPPADGVGPRPVTNDGR